MLENLRLISEVDTIATTLKLAKEVHSREEKSLPKHEWQDWYAAFIYAVDHGADNDEAGEAANQYIVGSQGSH